MPERNWQSNTYRHGFNGKENDLKLNDWQDYGNRMYMRRLVRFPTPDPIAKKYPELSVYQFASNTPIQAIDLDGLEAYTDDNATGLNQFYHYNTGDNLYSKPSASANFGQPLIQIEDKRSVAQKVYSAYDKTQQGLYNAGNELGKSIENSAPRLPQRPEVAGLGVKGTVSGFWKEGSFSVETYSTTENNIGARIIGSYSNNKFTTTASKVFGFIPKATFKLYIYAENKEHLPLAGMASSSGSEAGGEFSTPLPELPASGFWSFSQNLGTSDNRLEFGLSTPDFINKGSNAKTTGQGNLSEKYKVTIATPTIGN